MKKENKSEHVNAVPVMTVESDVSMGQTISCFAKQTQAFWDILNC